MMLAGNPLFIMHLPFSQAIMEEYIPRHLKAPLIKAYDGSTDPCNHLKSFKDLMMLQEMFNALICKSFSTIFRDIARAWYTKLPLDSISSFKEFNCKFIIQFQSINSNFLFSIHQEEEETPEFHESL